MVGLDRRSLVLVGVVAVACGGDSAADGEGGSTDGDATQGDDDDDDDDDDGSTSASGSSETGTSNDTQVDTTGGSSGAPDCTADEECGDPNAPICIDGVCVPCGDESAPEGQCAEIDATVPVCGPDGACVQCTADDATVCTDNTPVCDVSTSSCIKCTAHEECPESACDIETGACFETDCVVDVDIDGDGDYLDVVSALEGETDDACVLRVHPADNVANSYDQGQVSIDGRTIALLGVEDARPIIFWTDSDTVDADGGAVLYLSHVAILGSVRAGDAVIWMETSDLLARELGGVIGTSDATRWHVRNSWIGGLFAGTPSVEISNGELDALYSTFIGVDAALQCSGGTVALRNSLVLGTDDAETGVDCEVLEAEYSAFESSVRGEGNVELGQSDPSWFVGGPIGARLTDAVPAELATTARWTAGDPTVDIDGDPRPDRDGTADFAGADVFVAR